MRAVAFVVLILAPACTTTPPHSAPLSAVLAITGATVIDATGAPPRDGVTVLVEGGRIQAIGPAGTVEIPQGAQVVDAAGKYLIPGLWDTHVHLTFTTDSALPLFVADGATSVRDVGSRLEEVRAMRERVHAGKLVGPRIRTSGPLLESAAWMQAAQQVVPPEHHVWEMSPRVVVSKDNARAVVDSLVQAGADFIKARNVWGEDFLALAAATEHAGIPLASHHPRRLGMLEVARSGLDSFEHAEGTMKQFDTLSVATRQEVLDQVAETGVLFAPTLMADVGYSAPDGVILAAIADTLGLLDARNRILPEQMRINWREAMESRKLYGRPASDEFGRTTRGVRAMNRAGIPMLAGTDVGGIPLVYPGSSLHEELELLVREGGLAPIQALQSATRNPPRFFGMQDEMGTIAPGKIADLVLLDANPLEDIRNTRKISAVVLNGRYLDRQALDELRAEARNK